MTFHIWGHPPFRNDTIPPLLSGRIYGKNRIGKTKAFLGTKEWGYLISTTLEGNFHI